MSYGTLVSVRPVKIQGGDDNNVIGAIGGAVLGGFLGNTIGGGTGRSLATAGGAIQALSAQGLAGKVAISGQDADLAAIKRIINGTQTMTVYKPITQLATEAANIAIELGNEKTPASNGKLNNGLKEVPSRLLTPIPVNKENIDSTVVKDGFHKKSEL